ncbi:MAG: hypothetical protein KAR87_04090 [Candidatus Aenigmarchaeota archaeon]|nr:hypothetical protein [Candidatus Aenigmarchaeota archaeon]
MIETILIERMIYIFFMCAGMRCIRTVQEITRIQGQKKATSVLIALDTTLFLFVFRDVLVGEPNMIIFLTIAAGYIAGYYIGSYIEEKMALGKVEVSIKIGKEHSHKLARVLRENGFIFIQSKRYYSHKGKLRKMHEGIIYRKELPKLKKITEEFNIVGVVSDIKSTFGKEIFSTKEYLKINKEI